MTVLTDNIKSALYGGRIDIILSIIKNCDIQNEPKVMFNEIDDNGTMLHIASKLDNSDLTRALLINGADVTIKNKFGHKPYEIASNKNKEAYVDEIFRRISQNDLSSIEKLFEGGLNVNATNPTLNHNNLLHWAAIYGSTDILKYLFEKGVNLNGYNDRGLTPIHESLLACNVDNFKSLIDLGADIQLYPSEKCRKHFGQTYYEMALEILRPGTAISALHQPNHDDDDGGVDYKQTNQKVILLQLDDDFLEYLKTLQVNGYGTGTDYKTATIPSVNGVAHTDSNVLGSVTGTSGGPGNSPIINGSLIPLGGSSDPPENPDGSHKDPEDEDIIIQENMFLKVLWPKPRCIELYDSSNPTTAAKNSQIFSFSLPPNVNVCLISKIQSITPIKIWEVWEIFRESFSALGSVLIMQPASQRRESNILCLLDDHVFGYEQGYKLVVQQKQIKILARDISGLYYGISTLREMLRASPEFVIPRLTITDWPLYRNRGIMIDLSLGRIPKIGHLTRMIDFMAGLKMNRLYLYFPFDISIHLGDVWQPPYTAMDILFLERYCQECCIQLVPAIDVEVAEFLLTSSSSITSPSNSLANDHVTTTLVNPTASPLRFYKFEAVRQYVDSFTNARELFVGKRITRLLSLNSPSSFYTSKESDEFLGTIETMTHSMLSRALNEFLSPYMSNGFGTTNSASLTFDGQFLLGHGEFSDVLEQFSDHIGPGSIITVPFDTISTTNLQDDVKPDEKCLTSPTDLLKHLKSNGLPHYLTFPSSWGESVAGNCKSDFPTPEFSDYLKNTFLGSSGGNKNKCTRKCGVAGDLSGSLGAIFQLLTGDLPNLSDFSFSWPTVMPLAAHLWNGFLPKQSEFFVQTLPYILSWHVFPHDVECMLANTLLELAAIEHDANRRAAATGYDISLDHEGAFPLKNPSFFYGVLKCPDDTDLQNFSVEYFAKIVKILRKIHSNLTSWQKKIESAGQKQPLLHHPSLNVPPSVSSDPNNHHLFKPDTVVASYECCIELMTLACRISKCLMIAGSAPTVTGMDEKKAAVSQSQDNSTPLPAGDSHPLKPKFINPGLANINTIHKTDLANKVLDIITLFKKDWLEHNLEDNLAKNVAYLETLFTKLVPTGTSAAIHEVMMA